ncbi:MAG: IS1634 family transposase [Thermoleophilaceae bacterium]
MHVVTNTIRRGEREYTSVLLRRSYREGGRVRKETLANLSHLPAETVELVRRSLRGEQFLSASEAFEIERSLPHGHVAAVLAVARWLELPRLLERAPSKQRERALAMICQRVLEPGSKLACTRQLAQSTLAEELGVQGADTDDLYAALDWLGERQGRIEERLAGRHLEDGDLVLYDVSSTYFEGRTCPLARRGYSRDRRRGSLQIVYGLLCDREGRPLAVEVFEGSLHDDKTLPVQVEKLRARFGLARLLLCLDRGMVTEANLGSLRTEGIAWITALKAPQVKRLARTHVLQPSLFDQLHLAEVTAEEYPGERLVVCRNPLVADDRARRREELLQATERELAPIRTRVQGGTLRGKAEIGLAVGAVANRYKVKKHFLFEIEDDRFAYRRDKERIAEEAALDGIYVLRTSVSAEELAGADVVRSYKRLAEVERAFRTLKSVDLEIRPINHRQEQRVRAHVFLCMLAYYLEWHLRRAWAELTFEDEQPPLAADPVAKAERSPEAKRKAQQKRTAAGEPCHSFRTLLRELALVARTTNRIAGTDATFLKVAKADGVQRRALELVGLDPERL